ncbi:MAG: ABC transporter ATP-binding protein, partial [Anaerolineae bacterium]|nr:ABC transporter ATP-binding protein [Anaerolineae bacterium]
VAMDLMQPRMIQRIVDEGIAQQDMTVVLGTGQLMLGFALIGAIGGIASSTFSVLAGQGFGADLRDALFTKVHSLSFGNIDRFETGQLITRLTNDVTQVEQLVGMLLRIMLRAPLLVIGSLIMAALSSPQLAVIFIVQVPFIIAVLYWVINKAYPMFGDVQERLDHLNTVMQENLAGVRVVKAFVREDHEIGRFEKVNEGLMGITVRAARIIGVAGPAMSIALNSGVVAAIWFGGLQLSTGDLQAGQIIAFVNYLTRTGWSLMFVSMLSIRVARAQASAERIEEVLQSQPQVQNKPDAMGVPAATGHVAFEKVWFSYDGDSCDVVTADGIVLRDLTFSAKPGETIAILGATGSGKSSLVHLIPRFYDAIDGRVTVDDTDVRDLDKAALRRHIGVALQESVLFSGTIRDNIRYGRPDATDEEVEAAARAAQAHEFIMAFPGGYDTVLGQRGVNVSGGQKQRIAIARALLIRPAVLILDDSTSSVDVDTEAQIQESLNALMENALQPDAPLKTCFIIAQRISTVLNADRILVLDEGRIAAAGTHDELMSSSPLYREIYDSQLGNGVTGNG